MAATDTFDAVVSGLDYPVFVVTTFDGRQRAGCLVGFTTQCSIDPPRYLVCLSKANHTSRTAAGADVLVVHVLDADQTELARLFGEATGDETDKFAACSWRPGPEGAPVLDDCARWFAGRIVDRVDLGDHVGFCLEPLAGADSGGVSPMMFSAVRHLDAGHRA